MNRDRVLLTSLTAVDGGATQRVTITMMTSKDTQRDIQVDRETGRERDKERERERRRSVSYQFDSFEFLEVELMFKYQRITARPPALHARQPPSQ